MFLILGGGYHLFFKKLGKHLLLLVVRVHVRPPRQMDEHLLGVSTRRDGRSCPTTEYSRRYAGWSNIGWWEKGQRSVGNRPTDWRGVVAAVTEQRGEGKEGFATRKWSPRVLSPTKRPVPVFLLSGVPERTPGAGDGLGSPDG
jgi:hypothetical protein